ncbi:putative phage-type endonuclease [Allochromatium warmingii]|uniref:Putative phage-type endonuclease n=1 Tax=Allochromatium warmingii TaxID=61595 RepID=A0A1H3DVV0_ALLWA|nr:YqaJ viral recombinase family protein [Allochromatium warmingii]SDX70460.1 putative phage-type endonuclease [Allochromatium warmingii]
MLTEEHRAQRRRGIGGSDVAAIAGLSPWRTPLDVYLSKVRDVEQSDSDVMRWGSILEAPIADEYARLTGNRIRRINRVLAHPEHCYILASLDRQIVGHPDGPGVLEIKTAGRCSAEWYRADRQDWRVVLPLRELWPTLGSWDGLEWTAELSLSGFAAVVREAAASRPLKTPVATLASHGYGVGIPIRRNRSNGRWRWNMRLAVV